jgi:hypothetical protein
MAVDPASHLAPVWQIWRNPLVWRYARSRLRLRKALVWFLLVGMVAYFAAAMVYLPFTERGVVEVRQAARNLFWVAIFTQLPILIFLGTGAVAYGIVTERLSGALDYQRMAPLSPAHKIVGYLFGLPIREYALFALTLPIVLFATFVGEVPWHKVLIVYLLFGSSAVLYHLTALALGMVISRWWVAALGTQIVLFILYIFLPQLSNLQIHLFESLTIMPAVSHYLGPYILPEMQGQDVFLFGKLGEREVPFFAFGVPQTAYSLCLQLGFMGMFFAMLLRKWVQEHHHALSKAQSLVVFGGFLFLLFANLWPIFTTDLTGEVQSRFPIPVPPNALPIVISVVVTVLLTFFGGWLVFVVTPNWHAYLRGWRRADRLGRGRVPLGWDESPAFGAHAVLAVGSALAVGLVLWLLQRTGYFELLPGGWVARLPAALALGGLLWVLGSALATVETGRTVMLFLLVGILPLMVGAVIAAVDEDRFGSVALFLAACSPLGTLVMSLVAPNLRPSELAHVPMLVPAMWTGLGLIAAYAVALAVLWRKRAGNLRRQLGG